MLRSPHQFVHAYSYLSDVTIYIVYVVLINYKSKFLTVLHDYYDLF